MLGSDYCLQKNNNPQRRQHAQHYSSRSNSIITLKGLLIQCKFSNHIDCSAGVSRAHGPYEGHAEHTSRVRTWVTSFRNRDKSHVTQYICKIFLNLQTSKKLEKCIGPICSNYLFVWPIVDAESLATCVKEKNIFQFYLVLTVAKKWYTPYR